MDLTVPVFLCTHPVWRDQITSNCSETFTHFGAGTQALMCSRYHHAVLSRSVIACLSICLSVSVSLCPSLPLCSLSLSLSVWLYLDREYVCHSLSLTVSVSVCLSLSLSVCPPPSVSPHSPASKPAAQRFIFDPGSHVALHRIGCQCSLLYALYVRE